MLNLGQRKEFTEPIFRALRTGRLHRFVQNDGLHLITIPKSPIASTSRCALIVVIESQGLVVTFQHGIDLILCGEVTRVALFIRMGVSGVGMVLIIRRSVATDQRRAVVEHIRRPVQYSACAQILVANNGLQCSTAVEHLSHILHIGRIERTQIKRREFFTVVEHTVHILHIGRIERTEVKRCEFCTAAEHAAHIRHLAGVERTEVKRRKGHTAFEHLPHFRHLLCIIKRTQIKRREGLTCTEHTTHIRHFLCIERTQVKRCEFCTTAEHTTHIRHIGRIERTEVKRREFFAAVEHASHIRHIIGHKVLQAFYFRHFRQC